MLRHTDRRKTESDADVTRDAEERRMQATVAVDQQDVRSLLQATDGRLNPGEFAIRQIRRDVGKLSPTFHGGGVDQPEGPRVARDRNAVPGTSVATVIERGGA